MSLPDLRLPDIRGAISPDPALIERCSRDMSRYRVRPRLVASPADEDDVLRLLAYAAEERVPVTCRGAGSNLSGSAVGPGMVVLSERMNGLLAIGESGATVQPGIKYE